MAGIPYVLSVHGMLSRFSLRLRFMKKRAYLALVEGRTIKDASVVHYTAVAERDSVPTRFRGLRSVVVPHAVEAESLLRIPLRMERSGPLRVVIIGRLHPVKGFDLLVPALAEVRRCGIDARLNVVGPDDDGYGAEVRRMARVWGVAEAVEFAGEKDGMGVAATLEAADLLVAPSYHENFGMAVVEGMAAGRPVIVSRGVAIADDVSSQGAGVVVPLEVNALAAAIRRLAESPEERVRLGEAGRRLVVRRYVGSAVAKPMLEVYRDVLARAGRTGRKAGEECGTGASRCEC
jgi:glycosyltransferase involved in cell wall biosynthesis